MAGNLGIKVKFEYLVHGIQPDLAKERSVDKGARDLVVQSTQDYMQGSKIRAQVRVRSNLGFPKPRSTSCRKIISSMKKYLRTAPPATWGMWIIGVFCVVG